MPTNANVFGSKNGRLFSCWASVLSWVIWVLRPASQDGSFASTVSGRPVRLTK